MKKQILNLGKALNKVEQSLINGGKYPPYCSNSNDCGDYPHICDGGTCRYCSNCLKL